MTLLRFEGLRSATEDFLVCEELGGAKLLCLFWSLGGFRSCSRLAVVPLNSEALLCFIEGFRDTIVASLPCLEGAFGGFFPGTSFDDCAGEAEGLTAAVEAFLRFAFDGRGVGFEPEFDAVLSFFGPNFGAFLSFATIATTSYDFDG